MKSWAFPEVIKFTDKLKIKAAVYLKVQIRNLNPPKEIICIGSSDFLSNLVFQQFR